ncbi:MAG: D-TA family PLP-dependent enzyme [Pirellulaceae bacterium]|nr:D-TA family PLP-dependent enzyme [Pirellulaceae bacterium]
MFTMDEYQLADPSSLITPCLLVYPHLVRKNLAETIRIAGSAQRLRPHVKTHKTPQIVHMELAAGITKHKCATLSEARMLAECRAPDVLIAYPQVGPAVTRLGELVDQFPATRFSTVVDNATSLKQLEVEFEQHTEQLSVLVDVDTGMHRTGILLGDAADELYRQLSRSSVLAAGGLHVYDGQNHQSDVQERRAAVDSLFAPVLAMVERLAAGGVTVPKLVCGGTPTFPIFAELAKSKTSVEVECSPGTCVLTDFNYSNNYRDMAGFRPAAVLMTRVISKPFPGRVTVDLGYKAVASDPPAGRRCHFLNLPDAKEIQHSEEHLVVESPAVDNLTVGDVLYVVPAHICPTVALHSHMIVVEDGRVVDRWRVTARDRLV